MALLIAGLVLFLGAHSVRIVADPWRTRVRERRGEGPWKGLYSLVSIVGFALICYGYGVARADPLPLWSPPPAALRHLAALLTVPAFVLLAAAYVPGNAIKARLGHPMILGVKLWALAHLLANNTLADLLLFGSFLVWAVLAFRAARRRDRQAGAPYPPGRTGPTLVAVMVGIVAWAAFAWRGHLWLIGVQPIG